MDASDLAKRMKGYEVVPKNGLMHRVPVAIRIDGKAFHTFTRGFKRPFDEVLIKSMQETMKYLCENVQGCVLGYTQSDEITLILIDYQKLTSDAWFDYEVQKICSVVASMATFKFNKCFVENAQGAISRITNERSKPMPIEQMEEVIIDAKQKKNLIQAYEEAIEKGAMFDARCFNIPKEEVTNLIYWRQLDALRNSVQMVGQAYFSHGELQNKSYTDIQEMLMSQKGINWYGFPTHQKRGSCCVKRGEDKTVGEEFVGLDGETYRVAASERAKWIIDKEIPIFGGEYRSYIDKLIMVGE